MVILGIADKNESPCYVLLRDGDLLGSSTDPATALAGIGFEEIDAIAYYQKPYLALERALETFLASAPRSLSPFRHDMPRLIKDTVYKKRTLTARIGAVYPQTDRRSIAAKLLFSDQTSCLCAQAFYPSAHEEAVILCLDDTAEWSGTAVALGQGSTLTIEREISYPHSLGLFMEAFAAYLGIARADLGALAKQGEPTYARMLARSVIDIKQDGSFLINQFYFDYASGGAWTNAALHDLLGGLPRAAEEGLAQRHRNIAASIMAIVAEVAARMVHAIARDYRGIHTLCVTGCVSNEAIVQERIMHDHPFDYVDIPQTQGNPAWAGGAALMAYYMHYKNPRDVMFLQNLPTAARK